QWKGSRRLPPPPAPPNLPPFAHGGTRNEGQIDGYMGTSLGAMQKHLFEGEKVSVGILNGFYAFSAVRGSYEFMTALASAYNDWQIAEGRGPPAGAPGS